MVGAGRAEAECASPQVVVSPRDGARVPVDPVLYVFMPSWRGAEASHLRVVADGGGERMFAATVVSKSDAVTALRVRVDSGAARRLTVSYGSVELGRYAIDRSWRPSDAPVQVTGGEYVHDVWTCSHTDAHFVTATAAPAYRVDWAETPDAFAAGTATSVVLPRHADDFWHWGDGPYTDGDGRIGLGYLSCLGETAASGPSIAGRYVCVRGLYEDGSTSGPCDALGYIDRDGYRPVQAAPPPEPVQVARVPAGVGVMCGTAALAAGIYLGMMSLLALCAALFGFGVGRGWVRAMSPERRERIAQLRRRYALHALAVVALAGAIALVWHNATTRFATAGEAGAFVFAAATWAAVAGWAVGLVRASGSMRE